MKPPAYLGHWKSGDGGTGARSSDASGVVVPAAPARLRVRECREWLD